MGGRREKRTGKLKGRDKSINKWNKSLKEKMMGKVKDRD